MNLKDKKVLITGADGFIGSHLVEAMTDNCAGVRALACYNSFNSRGWLENIDNIDEIEVISGDIRDPYFCKKLSKGYDLIFHLAALIGIPYSYVAPDSYVDTNIKGTMNICQAALENDCQKLIHTSTSEVYGTALYVPIDENHPLQAQSPYSASKIGADAIAKSFHSSFGLNLSIAKPFNTYGPRQSARAIIPTIISQLLNGKKEISLGSLHPTRDLNYVKDTVSGFIAIAESENSIGETINISSGREISMGELADKIISLINPEAKVICDNERLRPQNSEVERLLGDNQKIKRLTGWEPSYSLDKGIEETIRWFENPENLKIYKSGIYNI